MKTNLIIFIFFSLVARANQDTPQSMMERIEKYMQESRDQFYQQFFDNNDPFKALEANLFGRNGMNTQWTEDEQTKTLEVKITPQAKGKSDLKVSVEDEQVKINLTSKSEEAGHVSESNISKQFSIPSDVDPKSAKVVHHPEGGVSITFQKINKNYRATPNPGAAPRDLKPLPYQESDNSL